MRSSLFTLYTNYPMDNHCQKNHSKQSLCRTLLLALQDSILLAVQKWNEVGISMNIKCRCSLLKENVKEYWGSKSKVENIEEFSHLYLSEEKSEPKRQKRFGGLAFFGGMLIFTLISGLLSWGIAEAVTAREVKNIREEIIEVENLTISAIKSSEKILSTIEGRVSFIEEFMELTNYAYQSGQEAENLLSALIPRMFSKRNEKHVAKLQYDFQKTLIDQIKKDSNGTYLEKNEIMKKLHKIKKSTTFISWLQTKQNFKCENSSIITMMVAMNYEEDNKLYARDKATGAFISNKNETNIYFTNQYSLKNMKKNIDDMTTDTKADILANRRMVTSEGTYLVFSNGNKPENDRITVFFQNNTVKKATIKCNKNDYNTHVFRTGSTIDLPLHCCVISEWWNATGIKFYSEKEKNKGFKTFSVKWKPVKVNTNLSHEFDDIRQTVVEFVKIRNEAIKNNSRISVQDLFNSMNNLVSGTAHVFTSVSSFLDHISENKTSVGAVGISFMTLLLLISQKLYNKRKQSHSNNKNGYELTSLKHDDQSSSFLDFGSENTENEN